MKTVRNILVGACAAAMVAVGGAVNPGKLGQ